MTADHLDESSAHLTDAPEGGSLVGKRYRLGDVLGQGGFGVVYAAADELLRRRVAVKEVRFPPGTTDTDRAVLVERVKREARSAARLHHPGVVAVLDVIDDGGRPWIVMELVEARSLSTVISEDGPLSPAAAAKMGVSIAYALEAAHRAGVVHRDVKPGNVLITPDNGARLTDFGIALTADDPKLTRTGMLVGSPAYIAPERARGGAGGAASDVWGLGATLYAAVEGAAPFESDNAIGTLTAVVEGRRRPFQLAGPLAPLIDDLMAVDESVRPGLSTARRRLREIADPESGRRGLSSRRVSRIRSGTVSVATGSKQAESGSTGPNADEQHYLASSPAASSPAASSSPAAPVQAAQNQAAKNQAAKNQAARNQAVSRLAESQEATTTVTGPGSGRGRGTRFGGGSRPAGGAPFSDGTPAGGSGGPASAARASLASAFRRRPGDPRGATAAGGANGNANANGNRNGNGNGKANANGATAAPLDPPARPPTPNPVFVAAAERTPAPPEALADGAALGTAKATPDVTPAPSVAPAPRSASAPSAAVTPAATPVVAPQPAPVHGARATLAAAFRRHPGDPRAKPLSVPEGPPPALPARVARVARPDSVAPMTTLPATGPPMTVPPVTGPPMTGPPPTPDAPNATGPSGWTDGRRLRLAVVAAGLVAVVAALGGVVVMGSQDDSDSPGPGVTTAVSTAATEPSAVAPPGDPGLVARVSQPAPAPPGWVSYQDPAGWSVAYPADWVARPRSAPGNVDFENPGTGALLRIGSVGVANPSAIADWLAHEQSFQTSEAGYRRVRLEPSDNADGSEQADWEFTYTKGGETVHALNRGVIRNGHGYALYWRTAEGRWSTDEALMWRLFSTFRPGP